MRQMQYLLKNLDSTAPDDDGCVSRWTAHAGVYRVEDGINFN